MKRVKIKCPYCGARATLRPAAALGKTAPGYAGKRYYVCARYRKLSSVTIRDGSCVSLQYQRTGKARTGSNVFFQYMDDLIAAVCAHKEAA